MPTTHSDAGNDELNTSRVVYLARHGETDWNRERRWQGQTDTVLNAEGRRQAEVLAEAVAALGIACIHASDLARARETAEIVALRLGIARVVPDPDLRERNFGVFEGLTFSECAERFPEMWTRYRADRTRPEGAESDAALAERMSRAVERVAHHPGTGLIVTHGGAIRMFLQARGAQAARKEGDFALGNGALLRVRLAIRSDTWTIARTEQLA